MRVSVWFFSALSAFSATTANAAFDLRITEIWPGNDPGENLTSDWFEVTNFGDTAWTAAVDGDLYFDDDSQGRDDDFNPPVFDSSIPDLMSGIATINPGESVVFVDDDTIDEFAAVWGTAVDLPQIGIHAGSGLGQGGDGVTLFISVGAPAGLASIIDFQAYPAADLSGGQSYDVTTGEFSTVAGFAAQTSVVNDLSQPAIGSPGFLVPEPTTVALIAMLAGSLAATRRR